MAYVNQERKAKIAAALKLVIPRDWRWSLKIRHHSTLVLTIRKAPVDLLKLLKSPVNGWDGRPKHSDLNVYWLREQFLDPQGKMADLFMKIKEAMNEGNHDRSDLMTDYFDVGWYTDIRIGEWDKPFEVLSKEVA